VDSYHTLVPGFRRLLAARGGDWEGFFRDAAELGRLSRKERHRRLSGER
jgi:predicted aminopeptidase